MDKSLILLKKVKELCKEFGSTASMLKGALTDGRKLKVNQIKPQVAAHLIEFHDKLSPRN
jgi:hypothetical protein